MIATLLFPAILHPLLTAHPHTRHLIVGYSGGLDSHALLHGLATHRHCWPERTLAAVYVDHGLQAASADWGNTVYHIAAKTVIDSIKYGFDVKGCLS